MVDAAPPGREAAVRGRTRSGGEVGALRDTRPVRRGSCGEHSAEEWILTIPMAPIHGVVDKRKMTMYSQSS